MTTIKTMQLGQPSRELTAEEYDELRQNIFKLADATEALADLQKQIHNPDLARVVNGMRDLQQGGLGYFTKIL